MTIRSIIRSVRCARWCLILGGVSYSSWVLGYLVPTGLSQRAAYASELEAAGQPYGWLFRGCDIVSGLLLAAGALLALSSLAGWAYGRARFLVRIALVGVVVTGVTTVLAALLTVDCTSSTGACAALRARGVPRSWHDLAHHGLSNVSGWGFAVTLIALLLLVLAPRDGRGQPDRPVERALNRALSRPVVIPLVILAALTSSPAGDLLWVASWRGVPQRINEAVESVVFVVVALGTTTRQDARPGRPAR